MKFLSSVNHILVVYFVALIFGLFFAVSSWPLAKVLMALWILIWVTLWIRETAFILALRNLLIFLTSAASLCGFVRTELSRYEAVTPIVILVAIFFFVFRRKSPSNQPTADPIHFHWPDRFWVARGLLFFCLAWLCLHILFNFILGKPIILTGWSALFLAVFAFCALYPPHLQIPWSSGYKLLLNTALPLALMVLLGTHEIRYWGIERNRNGGRYSLEEWAQRSFNIGYKDLGVRIAVAEAARRSQAKGWPEAVNYLRSQWVNESKIHFAKAVKAQPVLKQNLFFFATCFGCSMQLEPAEEAVDWVVLPEKQQIWILTSQGRVLRIDEKGVFCPLNSSPSALALAVEPQNQTVAVLQSDQIHIHPKEGQLTNLSLSNQTAWKDLCFARDGQELWLMDSYAGIHQVVLGPSAASAPQELFPPLWGQNAIAQSLLFVDPDSCLVLDQFGGVHLRGENRTPGWDEKTLSKHYHPDRPVMRVLALGFDPKELLLLNQSGWVYFVCSERPVMQVLFPPGEAVGLAALPQIDCILELLRNGMIIPYIMPQGAPLIFWEKAARVETKGIGD